MAKVGKVEGNHLWMQLNHTGRQTAAAFNAAPWSPSGIPIAAQVGCGVPVPMTENQITTLIGKFAHAATVARDTGFTGVQVHAAHGYLMSQFLSPLANTRTDAWGGCPENRARMLLETLRAIRRAVGKDFPVSVKLNSADFQKGGFTEEDSMQVVEWLGEEGIDLLEISGGNYDHIEAMAGRRDNDDEPRRKLESTARREAYFLDYAARVRPRARMPLMITGGFRSRAVMLAALQAGELDVVGLGRPMCVAPDLCRRMILEGLEHAPAPERSLRLVRAPDAEPLDEKVLHTMETWSQLIWSMVQVLRLADGRDADLSMTLAESDAAYEAHEAAMSAAMER